MHNTKLSCRLPMTYAWPTRIICPCGISNLTFELASLAPWSLVANSQSHIKLHKIPNHIGLGAQSKFHVRARDRQRTCKYSVMIHLVLPVLLTMLFNINLFSKVCTSKVQMWWESGNFLIMYMYNIRIHTCNYEIFPLSKYIQIVLMACSKFSKESRIQDFVAQPIDFWIMFTSPPTPTLPPPLPPPIDFSINVNFR